MNSKSISTQAILATVLVIVFLSAPTLSESFKLKGPIEWKGTIHYSENPSESFDTFLLGIVGQDQTPLLVDLTYDKTLIPGESTFK